MLILVTALVAQLITTRERRGDLERALPASALSPHSVGDENLDAVPGKIEAEARQELIKLHDLDPSDPRVNAHWVDDEVRGLMFARLLGVLATPNGQLDTRSELDRQYYSWFQRLVRDVNVRAAEGATAEYNTWKSQGCSYVPPSGPEYYSGLACRQGVQGNYGGPITASRAIQPTLEQFRTWGVARAVMTGAFPRLPDNADIELLKWTASATAVAVIAAAAGGAAAGSVGITEAGAIFVGSLTGGVSGFGAGALIIPVLAAIAAVLFIIQIVEELELPGKLQQLIGKSRELPNLLADPYTTDAGKLMLTAVFLAQLPPKSTGTIDLFDPNDPSSVSENPDRVKPTFVGSGFNVQPYDDAGNAADEETFVESQRVKLADGTATRIYYDRGWIVREYKNGHQPMLSLDYIDWDGNSRRALIRQDKWFDSKLPKATKDYSELADCAKAGKCSLTDTLRVLDGNGARITLKNVVNHAPPPVSISAPAVDDEDGPDCSTRNGSTICRPPASTTTLVEGGTLKLLADGINENRDQDADPITYRWTIEEGCAVTPVILENVQNSVQPVSVEKDCLAISAPGFNGPTTTKEGGAVDVTWAGSGTRLVKLEASDGRGLSSVAYRSFTIDNVAPTIRIASSKLDAEDVTVTGCIDDPGKQYEFPSLSVDWGDGNVVNGPASGVRLKQGDPPVPTTTIASLGLNLKVLNEEQLAEQVEKVDVGMTVSFDKIQGCTGTYSFKLTHTYAKDAVPPAGSDTFPVTITTSDGDGGGDSEVLRGSGFSPVDVTISNLRVDAENKNAIFRVRFAESVKGFDGSDLVLTGVPGIGQAQVVALSADENGLISAAVAVPMKSDGAVTLSIPAGAANAGRRPTAASRPASTNSDTIIADFTKPNAQIASTLNAIGDFKVTRERKVTFALEFSEPVNAVSLDDLEMSGTATRGAPSLIGSSPGQRYLLTVPLTSDGTVAVALKGGQVRDVAGNTADATASESVEVDQTPPTVTVNQADNQADPTSAGDGFVYFDVEFSEDVGGLDTSDFAVFGTAQIGALTLSGSNLRSYRLRVPVAKEGTVSVALPSGAAVDRAGNSSRDSTSDDRSVTVDRTRPEVFVSKAIDQPDPTQGSDVRFQVFFSEPVEGFDASDVSLSGSASHGAPAVTGSDREYTVTVPVTSGGTITMAVSPEAATDAVGNRSADAIAGDATVFSGIPPKLVVQAHDKTREYGAADPKFTVTFLGFVNGDTPDVLGGTRICTSTAEKTSPVGSYPITCSGITADTYQIVYAPGTLQVTKAPTALAVTPLLSSAPNVSARLTMRGDQPAPGNRVFFYSGSTLLCLALTDADGVATCTPAITGTVTSLVGGVTAKFDGTTNLGPSTGQAGVAG